MSKRFNKKMKNKARSLSQRDSTRDKEFGNQLLITPSEYTKDDLTPSQQRAVKIFDDWFNSVKSYSHQVLRIGGYGGTGKTVLIKYLVTKYKFTSDECYIVSYTGQSVNVLRKTGVLAKTIHSTFMHAKDVPILDKNGDPIYRRGVELVKTVYEPVNKIPSKVKLIIIDESSFLPISLENTIRSYGTPILEMGDPFQLPPVEGVQCFNMNNLDCLMTDIMRQEKDNEIIKVATAVRNGDAIDRSQYGNNVRFLWQQEDITKTFYRYKPFIKFADVVVTYNNAQRTAITDLYRSEIIKANSPYPIRGEKLICRRNDWSLSIGPYPLTNGTQGVAVNTVGKSEVASVAKLFSLDFKPNFVDGDDYFDHIVCDIDFLRKKFGDKDAEMLSKYNPGNKFEYAYAITTHLSQGSQYDNVVFIDAPARNPEYHARLRYTAITRARKRFVWMLPHLVYDDKMWTDLSTERRLS